MSNDSTSNKKSASSKIDLMKKGDYSVHILLEEVKNLPQIEDEHLPYPIVKLTCFGKSKRSEKPATECDSYNFGEHFYFEKTNLTVEQLDSSKLIIEVYDANNSRKRSDYFGIYEYDFQYIYSLPNHALQNYWLALANPESDDMTKVRGFLKLSISVLHDNDPRVELKENPGSEDCLVPSQIKLEYEQLFIYVSRAEQLPDMDSIISESKKNRSCDPYLTVLYQGQKVKTSVVKNKNDVADFNELLNVAVPIPSVSQRLVIKVTDSDFGSGDDEIGSIEINLNDIIGKNNKYENYTWFNIYGISRNKNGKIYDLMNNNAEIGSRWNGRVLMRITHKKVDTPITKTTTITDQNELNLARKAIMNKSWELYCKLYCGYYLPKEYDKYSVKIQIQESSLTFPSLKAINNYISWYKVNKLTFFSTGTDIDKLPDVYIYLLNSSGDPVCFQRIKPKRFHRNESTMIIKLFPEPCYDLVKNNVVSGLLKMKLSVFNPEKDGDIYKSKFKDGESDTEDNASFDRDLEAIGLGKKLKDTYTVVCCVYMCKYLISGDSNGKSDPYVQIKCVDNVKKTSVKNDSVNGIWNEKLVFDSVEMTLSKKSTWPVLLVEVKDYDTIGSDDILASAFLWLSDAPYKVNDTSLVKPRWYQLYLPKSNCPQGELLMSFYIFDKEHRNSQSLVQPVPDTVNYSFDINILGLRDLKPLSMLPIKKPYVKFDMNSLNVTGKKEDALQTINTEPKEGGNNPTINSVIKFDLKLPKDDIFMPELQCEVYDYIFKGVVNPMLGVFLLNVKSLIAKTNRQIDEDMQVTRIKAEKYMEKGLISNKNVKKKEDLDQIFESSINLVVADELSEVISTDKKRKEELIANDNKEEDDEGKKEINPKEVVLNVEKEMGIRVSTINDKEHIDFNKDRAEFFVVLPKFKKYKIPGVKEEDPKFRLYDVEDESQAPNYNDYFALGYIAKPTQNLEVNEQTGQEQLKDLEQPKNITKHYRRIYHSELEKDRTLKLRSPFTTAYIRRGKYEDKKDETTLFTLMADENNKIFKTYSHAEDSNNNAYKKQKNKPETISARRQRQKKLEDNIMKAELMPRNLKDRGYGKFKAVIRVCEKEKMKQFEQAVETFKANDPKILKELKNLEKYEKLTKDILVKHEVIIRVYILELNDLAKKDAFSESDPYIKIFLGEKKKVDEQKKYKEDTTNAKWYEHYDILSTFPGDSSLKIEVWDYDPIFSDELIGSTTIDLEDRYFNSQWTDMKFKPIEVRKLAHPDIPGNQGTVSLWVEIFEKKDLHNMEVWQIKPEPESQVEMRLVIWETDEMRIMDVEDTSDIYVTAFVDPKERQSTDTHYRSTSGFGSFNWRIVLPIKFPSNNTKLNIQCFDKDIFSKDDFIAGTEIELRDILKIPKDLDVPITFNRTYVDAVPDSEKDKYKHIEFLDKEEDPEQIKFWVQCYQNNKKSGRVLCSLQLLPMWKAQICKVGKGREAPNENPYLPPPTGRFEWSLNPCKTLNQCVGPRFRRKMWCGICIVCCVIYLICLIPYMIYHFSGQIVNPFNWANRSK